MDYWLLIILLIIIGVLVAIPTSIIGLGGGILYTPILLIFFQFPPNNAVGISITAMLGNSVSSSIGYLISKKVNIKVALIYDLAVFPGVFLGALLTVIVKYNYVVLIISIALYFMGIFLLKKIFENKSENQLEEQPITYHLKNRLIPIALISSFFSGLISGLAGVGGGTINTTSMLLLGMPPHIAGPTSEFPISFTYIVGVLFHAILGNILWEFAIPLALGAVIGGQIGVKISIKIKPKILISILVIFVWISATRILIELFYSSTMLI